MASKEDAEPETSPIDEEIDHEDRADPWAARLWMAQATRRANLVYASARASTRPLAHARPLRCVLARADAYTTLVLRMAGAARISFTFSASRNGDAVRGAVDPAEPRTPPGKAKPPALTPFTPRKDFRS